MKRTCSAGFTLIELLIVLTIISIIATIAYPAYQDQVRKARRADGKSMLLDVMAREERFSSDNDGYTPELNKLGLGADTVLSKEGFYQITAGVCEGIAIAECVTLTATAQGAQENDEACKVLKLNSQGVKSPDACW